MKKFGRLLVLALLAVVALLPVGLAQSKGPVRSETTHTPGTGFEYPMLEAWEGPITGDIDGWIEWWIDVETWTAWPSVSTGQLPPNASHYTHEVRIYNQEEEPRILILKTTEHGTTTMANTSWRANGEVVFANPEFLPDGLPDLVGRRVHESGRFTVGPTGPIDGTSIFRIN